MCTHNTQHEPESHNPIHCILPPHILKHLANSDDPELRKVAVHTMEVSSTMRTDRVVHSLLAAGVGVLNNVHSPSLNRMIYDSGKSSKIPGTLMRHEGQAATGDKCVDEAYDYLGDTFNYYLNIHHRNSIDDAGMPLLASVHYSEDGTGYDNAFWNGQRMIFGDGDGQIFERFTISIDVIGHELTHGVTGHEANLLYSGQPGALNESVSDVFGSLIKQYSLKQTAAKADWLIGKELLKPKMGKALRSMLQPGTAYSNQYLGKDPQPDHMSKYVHTGTDNGGVHINSGIPNRAFALFATKIKGNAWDVAGQVWYDTIRDKQLKNSATFKNFADRTIVNAQTRFGKSPTVIKALQNAWKTVGVLP